MAWWHITLIVLGIVLTIGFVRILITRPSGFLEFILELLCIDLLFSVIGVFIEGID